MTVTTATGAYSYTKDAPAIEALNAGQNPSDVFTVSVTDGDDALVTQTFTVNITGANDGPPRFLPSDISRTPGLSAHAVRLQHLHLQRHAHRDRPRSGSHLFRDHRAVRYGTVFGSGSTLTSGGLSPSKTYTVTIQATQIGDPAPGAPETFTIITGNNGNSGDTLNGSPAGDDVLYGNENNSAEMLFGLGGNDTLFGMDGIDQLFGGDGKATF